MFRFGTFVTNTENPAKTGISALTMFGDNWA